MKAGLLGYPIAHSLSPAIHRAAYAELGLDWEYALYPCEDVDAFSRAIAKAQGTQKLRRGCGARETQETGGAQGTGDDARETHDVRETQGVHGAFVGFNVTTPYKAQAHAACTEHSLFSAVTGSSNVLIFLPNGASGQPRLRGDDTDGRGMVASLEREGGITVAGSSVLLCGTGPVASSALLALISAGASSIVVASRNVAAGVERVESLQSRLAALQGDATVALGSVALGVTTQEGSLFAPVIQVVDYAQAAACLKTADILIDSTPLGMNPGDGAIVPPEALRPGLVVLDTVYGHGETALLRNVREAGGIAIDGLGMLIEQAALTIELWAEAQGLTLEAPRETMRQAALGV
jgi:shikimate dehydrogenase